jgi:hypothetical protein
MLTMPTTTSRMMSSGFAVVVIFESTDSCGNQGIRLIRTLAFVSARRHAARRDIRITKRTHMSGQMAVATAVRVLVSLRIGTARGSYQSR